MEEEWKLCPVCKAKYDGSDACQHVVAACSLQAMDQSEDFGPIPMFNGQLESSHLLDIYLVAESIVMCGKHTKQKELRKDLPGRLQSLLSTLAGAIEGEPPDDAYIIGDVLADGFARYLEAIVTRGPTFRGSESWEDQYGYGCYMTEVYWAEKAARCARFTRRVIRFDVGLLRSSL